LRSLGLRRSAQRAHTKSRFRQSVGPRCKGAGPLSTTAHRSPAVHGRWSYSSSLSSSSDGFHQTDGRGEAPGRRRDGAPGTLAGFGKQDRVGRACWNSLDALGSCTICSANPVVPAARPPGGANLCAQTPPSHAWPHHSTGARLRCDSRGCCCVVVRCPGGRLRSGDWLCVPDTSVEMRVAVIMVQSTITSDAHAPHPRDMVSLAVLTRRLHFRHRTARNPRASSPSAMVYGFISEHYRGPASRCSRPTAPTSAAPGLRLDST
jgi:hypothetical protein